jgi:methylglutaconyl-CoA hydratase
VDTVRGVATVTLDSPRNRNALSAALIDELLAALTAADADASVRVIVLSHTGPVFCSGADLKETAAATTGEGPGRAGEGPGHAGEGPERAGDRPGRPGLPAARLGEVFTAIWESDKPVVARVGGPARAGGLGLIAAADLAVCATDATFAFSEVRLGVIPAVISATVLPRLAPRAAAELFLTGEVFDGVRAAAIGLVTAAVPANELDVAVARYTAALVRGAPGALAGAKALLRRTRAGTFAEELRALTEVSVRFFGSPEGVEGVRAFREKREPGWIPRA